jgi:hypothetical protein
MVTSGTEFPFFPPGCLASVSSSVVNVEFVRLVMPYKVGGGGVGVDLDDRSSAANSCRIQGSFMWCPCDSGDSDPVADLEGFGGVGLGH